MALVSLSRCSREARSSGGAFALAMSGGMPSFFGGGAAAAGDAGTLAAAFGSVGAVLPVLWPTAAAVDKGAEPPAGSTVATPAVVAGVTGGALGSDGAASTGAPTSASPCGGLLRNGASDGGALSAAQPDNRSTQTSPAIPVGCIAGASARLSDKMSLTRRPRSDPWTNHSIHGPPALPVAPRGDARILPRPGRAVCTLPHMSIPPIPPAWHAGSRSVHPASVRDRTDLAATRTYIIHVQSRSVTANRRLQAMPPSDGPEAGKVRVPCVGCHTHAVRRAGRFPACVPRSKP